MPSSLYGMRTLLQSRFLWVLTSASNEACTCDRCSTRAVSSDYRLPPHGDGAQHGRKSLGTRTNKHLVIVQEHGSGYEGLVACTPRKSRRLSPRPEPRYAGCTQKAASSAQPTPSELGPSGRSIAHASSFPSRSTTVYLQQQIRCHQRKIGNKAVQCPVLNTKEH